MGGNTVTAGLLAAQAGATVGFPRLSGWAYVTPATPFRHSWNFIRDGLDAVISMPLILYAI